MGPVCLRVVRSKRHELFKSMYQRDLKTMNEELLSPNEPWFRVAGLIAQGRLVAKEETVLETKQNFPRRTCAGSISPRSKGGNSAQTLCGPACCKIRPTAQPPPCNCDTCAEMRARMRQKTRAAERRSQSENKALPFWDNNTQTRNVEQDLT